MSDSVPSNPFAQLLAGGNPPETAQEMRDLLDRFAPMLNAGAPEIGGFHPKVPVYPKSIQVESPQVGDEIAEVLGDAPAVILKHHGAAVVGKSIEQAVAVSTILEDTARFLHAASVLGTPEPMPLEEIESGMALKIDRPSLSMNPWTYWSERIS